LAAPVVLPVADAGDIMVYVKVPTPVPALTGTVTVLVAAVNGRHKYVFDGSYYWWV
jgi:hypothetical protein